MLNKTQKLFVTGYLMLFYDSYLPNAKLSGSPSPQGENRLLERLVG